VQEDSEVVFSDIIVADRKKVLSKPYMVTEVTTPKEDKCYNIYRDIYENTGVIT
jgi:hypothetical protein